LRFDGYPSRQYCPENPRFLTAQCADISRNSLS
jgi:hypothetical protein